MLPVSFSEKSTMKCVFLFSTKELIAANIDRYKLQSFEQNSLERSGDDGIYCVF